MTPLSLLSVPKQSGNTRVACRGVFDKAFGDQLFTNARLGSASLTGSVDLASWQRQQIIWGCVDTCSTQNLDTTSCSHSNSTGPSRWKMNDVTSTTTHFVLFPKSLPPMLPLLTCIIVLGTGWSPQNDASLWPDSCGAASH